MPKWKWYVKRSPNINILNEIVDEGIIESKNTRSAKIKVSQITGLNRTYRWEDRGNDTCVKVSSYIGTSRLYLEKIKE